MILFAEGSNEVMVKLCQQLIPRHHTAWAVLRRMKLILHSKQADSEVLIRTLLYRRHRNNVDRT
jgi:hypothetical protein